MDETKFGRMTRTVAGIASRRSVVRGVAASGIAAALGLAGSVIVPGFGEEAEAGRRRKRQNKQRRRENGREDKCDKNCSSNNPCEEAFCNNKGRCKTRPAAKCTLGVSTSNMNGWFGYNDENDTIDDTLLSFVEGPTGSPNGVGSVEITVTGSQRRNVATFQFSGTPLAEITELSYSTYNGSAGNGGSVNRSGYLQFNVDFDGSDTWQRRLLYLPEQNGTVEQNAWQTWDAIAGGNANWSYSGSQWPVDGVAGSTTKTWNEILQQYPGVRLRVKDAWLGIRVGEPYPDGYTENIATFVLGTENGTTKTFEFRPEQD